MTQPLKKLIIIAIICFLPSWAFGATYTVCSSGCDKTTITAIFANNDLGADDVVEVRADTPGGSKTYSETVTFGSNDSGTSGHPIVLQGRSGDTITIDGGDTRWQGIDTAEQDHITIQRFTIQNITNDNGRAIDMHDSDSVTIDTVVMNDIDYAAAESNAARIINADTSDDLIVKNCTFSSGSLAWTAIYYEGDRFQFYNNTFSGSNYKAGAIYIMPGTNATGSDTGRIYNNTFTDVNSAGTTQTDGHMIGLAGGTSSSRTIDNIKIYQNTITGSGEKSKNTLIVAYNSENVDIYENELTSNNTTCIAVATNCYDVNVYKNLCAGNSVNADTVDTEGMIRIEQAINGCGACLTLDGVNVYNNTIANNDNSNSPTNHHAGIALICADVEGHTFKNVNVKNNIVSENMESAGAYGWELYTSFGDNPTVSGIVLDYNDYYRDSNTDYFIYYDGNSYTYAQFSNYQLTESQGAKSIDDDPLLYANFYIDQNSPAYGAGTDVGLHCGTADIGWDDPECRLTAAGITIGALTP